MVFCKAYGRLTNDYKSSNLDFSAHSQCFVRIFTKSTFSEKLEKIWILDPFWEAKATKNRENIVLRNLIFSNIDFRAIFYRFWRFRVDFGRPWSLRKLQEIAKNRCWGAFGTRSGLRYDFGSDLESILQILDGFWKGSGGILEGFWRDNK